MVTLVCQESVQVDEEGADLGQHRLENTLHQTMTEAKRYAMVSGFFFYCQPMHEYKTQLFMMLIISKFSLHNPCALSYGKNPTAFSLNHKEASGSKCCMQLTVEKDCYNDQALKAKLTAVELLTTLTFFHISDI